MTEKAAEISRGLEGIVIAQTSLSSVNGEIGRLIYRGYPISTLARNATYEEVVYLLWNQKLPNRKELDAFKAELVKHRAIPGELVDVMRHLPPRAHPMGILLTLISALGTFDTEQEDNSPEANRRKALRLAARIPTLLAAWGRIREGNNPIEPRDDLDHAANFMLMLQEQEASEAVVRAIDAYLVMLAEHGMNASTFSARVTTSTEGDMYSAVTTAIGTLKGPLHGGANERVMYMLLEIESPGHVEEWFRQSRAEGRRIMGIGHRVYKVEDPRATILREMAREIAESSGDSHWYDIAIGLEDLTRADDYFAERKLYPNVDYYTAIVFYAVGIPIDFFTPMFAMSRIAGWTAHIMEAWLDNRLMRPRGEYVGPMEEEWVPIEDRT